MAAPRIELPGEQPAFAVDAVAAMNLLLIYVAGWVHGGPPLSFEVNRRLNDIYQSVHTEAMKMRLRATYESARELEAAVLGVTIFTESEYTMDDVMDCVRAVMRTSDVSTLPMSQLNFTFMQVANRFFVWEANAGEGESTAAVLDQMHQLLEDARDVLVEIGRSI